MLRPDPYSLLRDSTGELAAAVNQFFGWGYRDRDNISWIEIDTSFRRPIFLSIVPLFPLSVIRYMDQFWGTMVIYPDGVSPPGNKGALKYHFYIFPQFF